MGAVLEFKQAFQSVASSEIRDLLAKDSLSELSSTSRSKNTIAEHKLLKLHVKCQSYLLVKENDVEMLLIAAELEVKKKRRTFFCLIDLAIR
jgi:type II secretory pathway component HofQ